MDKSEVIEALCVLADKVGEHKFKHTVASDCFCQKVGPPDELFRFDEEVLQFIKDAVDEKLNKEKSHELQI